MSDVELKQKGPKAQFYKGLVLDGKATNGYLDETGRQIPGAGRPIYKEAVCVRIFTPGDATTIIDQPAWVDEYAEQAHNNRFPQEWARFQAGKQTEFGIGTPLKEWTGIARSQVEELAYVKVYTVEDLAGISDGNLERMGPGYRPLRQKAKDWLEQADASAKKAADRAEYQAELAKRDAVIAQMQEQLAALAAPKAKAKQ